jgi:hypothetical protein
MLLAVGPVTNIFSSLFKGKIAFDFFSKVIDSAAAL